MSKLGSPISPLEVVLNGSQSMHAVDDDGIWVQGMGLQRSWEQLQIRHATSSLTVGQTALPSPEAQKPDHVVLIEIKVESICPSGHSSDETAALLGAVPDAACSSPEVSQLQCIPTPSLHRSFMLSPAPAAALSIVCGALMCSCRESMPQY